MLYCGGGALLNGVGHRDEPQQPAVLREVEGRFALRGEPFACREKLLIGLCAGHDMLPVASVKPFAARLCGKSASREHGKVLGGEGLYAPLFRLRDYRPRKGMLALFLKRARLQYQLLLGDAFRGEYRLHGGGALGDGARLVEHYGIDPARGLERRAGFYEYAVSGAQAVADHYGDGRCEPKRAGAGYDEHRNAPCHGKARRFSGKEPVRDHERRYTYDGRHEHGGDLVRDPRDGGLRRRRAFHQSDYA